jgi:hypothetical protein
MVYTSMCVKIVIQVDLGNLLVTEEDAVESISQCWTQGYGVAMKGFPNPVGLATEGDISFVINLADKIPWAVLDGWKRFRKLTGTGTIPASRDSHRQCFMGALVIVDETPTVKGLLAVL